MSRLKRVSHVSIFLLVVLIVKSALSILLRTLIASRFGAGTETDAYYAAFSIPQQLSDFFIGGILFAAIIPIFQKRREEAGDEKASKDISAVLNITFLILLVLTVIFYISVPWITENFFSGFDYEKQQVTIRYSRILSPSIILFGLSLVCTSLYHAFRDFVIPSFSALIFPASSIASIFLLPESWGIERLVYGNLAGSVVGFALLLFFILGKIRWEWNWNLKNPIILAMLLVSWPVLFENIMLKTIPFVINKLASELPINGAITLIQFSFFIINSTVIFISGPVSSAIFPLMGQLKAERRDCELFATFVKSLNIIFLFAVPLNVILVTQSREIVNMIFGYGKFTENDCRLTAQLISINSLIILPQCFQSVSGRIFFVFQETKLISFVSISLVLLSWPVYFITASLYGIYGIIGVFTGMWILGMLANFAIIKMKFKGESFRCFILTFIKTVSSGLIMAMTIILLRTILAEIDINGVFKFALFSVFGTFAFALSCNFMRIDEFRYLIKNIHFFL